MNLGLQSPPESCPWRGQCPASLSIKANKILINLFDIQQPFTPAQNIKATPKSYLQSLFQPLAPAKMLFTGLIASVLAVAATAAPNRVLTKRQANTSTLPTFVHPSSVLTRQAPNVTPEQIAFAIQRADCDVLSCVGVVAAAGCIAAGIATADVPAVLSCVVGGEGVVSSAPTPSVTVFVLSYYSFAIALDVSTLSTTSSSTTAFATSEWAEERHIAVSFF